MSAELWFLFLVIVGIPFMGIYLVCLIALIDRVANYLGIG